MERESTSTRRAALRMLEQHALTRGAAPETRAALGGASAWRVVAGDSPLFQSGEEALAFIHGGSVRLYDAGDPPRVAGYRGPGELVGEEVLAGRMRRAVAMTTVSILVVPAAVVGNLIATDTALCRALIEHLASRLLDAEARTRMVLSGTVTQRLAAFLLEAVVRWGQPEADGVGVDAPLTHDEIGEVIGATRAMVSVTLAKLRQAGVLAHAGRKIVIVDQAVLEDLGRNERRSL